MEPFFFGRGDRPLFGAYHPPRRSRERDGGVVLCNPMGEEYMRSHRAFLQLANRLAEEGLHVLRFDYRSCGDSADVDDVDLQTWKEDVDTAVTELVDSGVSRIALIGLRIGGSLATLTAGAREEVELLVLWNPVVDGSSYLNEVRAQHLEWLRGSFAKPRGRRVGTDVDEILGFALSPTLSRSVEALDLTRLTAAPARRVLIVDTAGQESLDAFRMRLGDLGVQTETMSMPSPPVWKKQTGDDTNIAVPTAVLDAEVSWIRGAFA